jgi:hypothetical protein
MRSIDRDRQRCFIARFAGLTRQVDGQGRLTGKNVPSYTGPEEFWPTVSPVRGEAYGAYFGQSLDYDLALTVDDPGFEVGEADILWVYASGGEPGGVEFLEGRDGLDGGTFDDWYSGSDDADHADGGGFASPDTRAHDYVVRKIARKGGFTVIAAKRVEVRP